MFLPTLIKYSLINRRHEKMSPEQIKKMQLEKFHKLVSYVTKHSLYYQKVIKQNKIDVVNCTPEDFPVLTKDALIEHFDEIVTDREVKKKAIADFLSRSHNPLEKFLNKYYIVHTSGSSGTISYYPFTENDLVRGVVHFTRFRTPTIGQKLAYVAATKGHFGGVTMISSAKYASFLYKKYKTFDINSPFPEILQGLQELQPTSLVGYAFALRKIAEAQKASSLHISPKIIQSGGEPLRADDKEFIEKVFQAPVINVYATSEHLIMGVGKNEYDGMYLMEDDLIFELQSTYICVTNLFNYTLPLIRYQMNDRLKQISDTTHKLPFTKVANIVGRNEHVPIFLNDNGEEDFISPHIINEFFVESLNGFQLHLLSNRSFIFKATLEKGLDKKTIEKTKQAISESLQSILNEKKMTKVKFTIEIVDHLWVDPKTGKFRLIVKK